MQIIPNKKKSMLIDSFVAYGILVPTPYYN